MTWLWILLAGLVGLAGVRHHRRVRSLQPPTRVPRVDDAALRTILAGGSLPGAEEDEPIDPDEAARAEDEFWSEGWDEPEEYQR